MTLLAPSGTPEPDGAGAPESGSATLSLLNSGLRVVTEHVPGVRSASVGVWIAAGSRDESADQIGAAHYLEHLLFKGTARRTAVQIAEEIDAVGGELNAFTAKEHTCFYAHVLDSDLPLAVDLLADVVTAATMAPEDVELERAVVLEEIAMRADDPEDLLGELFDTALFGDNELGRPVIGSEESIEGMTRDRLHAFWREHYAPPRMIVAAAGNVGHDAVTSLVAEAFPAETAAEPAGLRSRSRPDRSGTRLVLESDDTEQVHLMLGVEAFHRHDERRVALEVLNTVLGGGMSSRLFQQVREQRGLAYSVYSATTTYADTGQLAVYAGCQPDRLGEVVEVTGAILAAAAAGEITEAEVARAKGALRGGLVLGLEDTASRMNRIGRHELDHGRQRTLRRSLETIEAVTLDQVKAVAADVLSRPPTAAIVGPFDDLDALPRSLRSL